MASAVNNPTISYLPVASPARRPLAAGARKSTSRSVDCPAGDWLAGLREALPAYELGSPLGRGAYGLVHAARHVGLGRDVAIKQLWPDLVRDDDARARFALEARLTASLDHPNIVRVYDYVEAQVYALVLERMPGGTLSDRLRGDKVSPMQACEIALSALRGLEHAHGRGVLHRDIKPQNLLLDGHGVVKLADFGLAVVIGPDASLLTGAPRRPGTPAYMAPEQVSRTLGPVTAATDVWAVGAVLYEMLTGRRPHAGEAQIADMLIRRATEEATPVSELCPAVPVPLADAVTEALARLPVDRYRTAAAFARALESARRAAWGVGRRPWSSRSRNIPMQQESPG